MKPVLAFRVYPDRGRGPSGYRMSRTLYCAVRVYRTKQDMLKAIRSDRSRTCNKTAALCSGRERHRVEPGGRCRKLGQFAVMYLHRGQLDLDVVTHEVVHAVMRYADRVRINLGEMQAHRGDACATEEEVLAYAHGNMVNQIACRIHNAGLRVTVTPHGG